MSSKVWAELSKTLNKIPSKQQPQPGELQSSEPQAKMSAADPSTSGTAAWHQQVPVDVDGVSGKGVKIVGLFFLVFMAWALFFPITSAVVVSGKVNSDGQNKLVQHSTGGKVDQIFVKDGEFVEEGAALLKLDPIKNKAEMHRLEVRLMTQQAIQARLETQLDNIDNVTFPQELLDKSIQNISYAPGENSPAQKAVFDGIIADQKLEFTASQLRIKKQVAILNQQVKSTEQEIIGQKAIIKSLKDRISSLKEQVHKMGPAVEKGYIAKVRYQEIKSQLLDLQGQYLNARAILQSSLHKKKQIIEQINENKAQNRETLAEKLTSARNNVGELKNEIKVAQWDYKNSVIKAPASGVVTNLKASTIGGTVPANEIIAQIVPSNSRLIVEARVPPLDIDNVKLGNQAKIAINAYNQRLVDQFQGEVIYVAADSEIDQNTGESYFTVRLKLLEPERVKKLKMHAGMQGEVYIITGSRVFFSYMLQPISDSFKRAFREQ